MLLYFSLLSLIHMVDWFPTILEAVGIRQRDVRRLRLPKLDGISQWKMINGVTSAQLRHEFVYAINDVTGRAAIRSVRTLLVLLIASGDGRCIHDCIHNCYYAF